MYDGNDLEDLEIIHLNELVIKTDCRRKKSKLSKTVPKNLINSSLPMSKDKLLAKTSLQDANTNFEPVKTDEQESVSSADISETESLGRSCGPWLSILIKRFSYEIIVYHSDRVFNHCTVTC